MKRWRRILSSPVSLLLEKPSGDCKLESAILSYGARSSSREDTHRFVVPSALDRPLRAEQIMAILFSDRLDLDHSQ